MPLNVEKPLRPSPPFSLSYVVPSVACPSNIIPAFKYNTCFLALSHFLRPPSCSPHPLKNKLPRTMYVFQFTLRGSPSCRASAVQSIAYAVLGLAPCIAEEGGVAAETGATAASLIAGAANRFGR